MAPYATTLALSLSEKVGKSTILRKVSSLTTNIHEYQIRKDVIFGRSFLEGKLIRAQIVQAAGKQNAPRNRTTCALILPFFFNFRIATF
jgi:GTP1/Obg family GTP-binding protein